MDYTTNDGLPEDLARIPFVHDSLLESSSPKPDNYQGGQEEKRTTKKVYKRKGKDKTVSHKVAASRKQPAKKRVQPAKKKVKPANKKSKATKTKNKRS